MKRSVKIMALLLCLAMLVPQLVSCGNDENIDTFNKNTNDVSTESAVVTSDEAEEKYIFEIVYPTVSVSELEFQLTDGYLKRFKSKLNETKRFFAKNKRGSEDEFRDLVYELLSLKAEIATQRDIAYLLYYYDMSASGAWDDYLYAYELYVEAHDLFWAFYNQSKNSGNVLADVIKDIVQTEFGGNLVSVFPDADAYDYEMKVLEGEYDSLRNENASDEEMFATYKKYLIAANGFATSSSTDHYYEYACKHMYYRKDTVAQRNTLREYTKKYLVPLCKELKEKSDAYDRHLTWVERALSDKYINSGYDSFKENYLFDYFSTLPVNSRETMKSAFEKDRVLIGDRRNSYNTAMVYATGNTPICYFHESQATLGTMAHELGHYYARVFQGNSHYSYDLRETHSTANTLLLYSHLSNKLDSKAFTSAEIYFVYTLLYQTVSSVIKDEFDERIYARDPSTLNLADFERIMSELIDEYGVRDLSDRLADQLMSYWRRLGIMYPMKNYSYATAHITSLQIYIRSKVDYAAAGEIYRRIVEELENEGDFISTIVKAGLKTPYDEQTYIELKKLTDIY